MTRKPISKALRFTVLRRDDFRCQYCGAMPPAVVLEVDHIWPVSRGGTNEMENLATACHRCNRGKSSGRGYPAHKQERCNEAAEDASRLEGFLQTIVDDPYLQSLYGEIVI